MIWRYGGVVSLTRHVVQLLLLNPTACTNLPPLRNIHSKN